MCTQGFLDLLNGFVLELDPLEHMVIIFRIVPNVDVEGAKLERAHHAPWAEEDQAEDSHESEPAATQGEALTRRELRERGEL